jgi:chorismate mutase
MKSDLKDLEDRLKELDEKIAEVNKRMPAHSVKPPIMTELLALEDEREAVARQIVELKKINPENPD